MPRQLTIDGSRIRDIASFYDEINRVFMAGVGWPLARTAWMRWTTCCTAATARSTATRR